MTRSRVDVEFDINASPEIVMSALHVVERLPEWSPSHHKVQIESTDAAGLPDRVTMELSFLKFIDHEVVDYEWRDDFMSWNVVSSKLLTYQRGTYLLSPRADGTHAVYSFEFESKVPMPKFLLEKFRKLAAETPTKYFAPFAESYATTDAR